jgi:hypothetical protein
MKLLHNVTTVSSGAAHSLYSTRLDEKGLFQVDIVGTSATVALQGRAAPGAPWVEVASLTASGYAEVDLFPEMRADVSAVTAATINAWLVS